MKLLDQFITNRLHEYTEIMKHVKYHIDTLLKEAFGVDPERFMQHNPVIYTYLVLELTRDLFIQYQYEKKQYRQQHAKKR